MKIDIFNHLFPKSFYDKYINVDSNKKDLGKRARGIPTMVDLEKRFRILDEFGEYLQVLTLPAPPLEILAGPEKSPQLAQEGNDGLAEIVLKYPNRFIGFAASLPMNNVDAAIQETIRVTTTLGAKGVQIYTNVAGKPLDADEFQPLFDEIAKRDITIWMHPTRAANFPDYLTEVKSKYEIWWALGWPYETSVAMSRMVFSGMLDRYPNLRVITHHMGGMIPYFEGRVGYGWDQLGTRTSDEDYEGLLRSMKKRPVDYFKHFYADTALFGAGPATKCGLDFFGVDNIVFASDMPFEPGPGVYARETIRCVESLELTSAEKDKIYRRNAERLMSPASVSSTAR